MANLINRKDVQAAIAAPVLAKMGYKRDATLDTTILYGIGQLGADGREKSRHLFPQLTEAHQTAIQLLAERGITTPDAFRALCLLPGNTLTKTELSVKYWVVEFDGSENWIGDGTNNINSEAYLYTINHGVSICNVLGYADGKWAAGSMPDKTIGLAGDHSFYVSDSEHKTVSAWKQYLRDLKAAGTPLTVIYQLATPLVVPFSEPLNLTFTDFDPEDGIVLYDRDGEPLWQTHRINVWVNPSENAQTATLYAKSSEYPVEADRLSCIQYVDTLPEGVTKEYHLAYGTPNPEWVEQHKTLPVGIKAQLAGLGLSFNADYLARLEARVAALEAR